MKQTSLLWGGPGDYSRDNRFIFEVGGLRHHHLADLDRNGWLDIIFTSTTNRELFIYWNGPQGFDNAHKTRLPTGVCATVEVADLNGDGYLEIVVPNLFDPNPSPDKPQSFGGSPQGNTFIYWGGPEGYSPASRQILPSIGNADVAVADLDRDGRLDLVLTSYHAGHTRSHPSTIYWNSAQGFQPNGSPGCRPTRPRASWWPTSTATATRTFSFPVIPGWEPPQPGLPLLGRRRRILNRPAQPTAGAGTPFPQRHRHRPHL